MAAENSGQRVPGCVGVDHAALTVPDLEAAVAFYSQAFGGTQLYRLGPFDAHELPSVPGPDGAETDWTEAHLNVADARLMIAMLGFGDGARLELFEYERPTERRTDPPRNCDLGGHHVAFEVAPEALADAVALVADCGGRPLAGPIEVEAGSSDAGHWPAQRVHYVLDPWGNQLELIAYPEGR